MKTMTQRELMDAVAHLPPLPPDWPLPCDRGEWAEPMTLQEILMGMGTQGIWADTDTDDDRHLKRRAQEAAGPVEHLAARLKDVAQHARNADPQRVRRLVEVQGVLAKAAEQLRDLGRA